MKLKIWEMALLTTIVMALLCGFLWEADGEALSDKLVRIHVVANSDDIIDQELKLDVRDTVLAYLQPLLEDAEDRAEALKIIETKLPILAECAAQEVTRQGYAYPITVRLVKEYYPTRIYDTFSLPAGAYTSLRIEIGEAAGKNWWCVVYPALCMSAAAEEQVVALDDSEMELICCEKTEYVVKFKVIEWINFLKARFS